MKVTRDVVTDLLPIYYAGEASEDTRRLVDQFFDADREFARLAERLAHVRLPAESPAAPRELELDSFQRTKKMIRTRSWLLGFAIFCTLAPFSFVADESGVRWFMLRDAPAFASAYLAAAVGLWIAFLHVSRGLRGTRL